MATREALARARAALEQATTQLLELAAEGLDEHPTEEELEHANAYAATAAMMRRRAARLRADGNEEHAAYELERAEQFEARAEAKRAGRPMPRRLRTPAESLARVDEFRRRLAQLTDDFGDVDAGEWAAFVAALRSRSGDPHIAQREALAFLEQILAALGVGSGDDRRVFAPFASPLDPVVGEARPRPMGARSAG